MANNSQPGSQGTAFIPLRGCDSQQRGDPLPYAVSLIHPLVVAPIETQIHQKMPNRALSYEITALRLIVGNTSDASVKEL